MEETQLNDDFYRLDCLNMTVTVSLVADKAHRAKRAKWLILPLFGRPIIGRITS